MWRVKVEAAAMHELALADAVVKAARRAAEDAGISRIERVVVRVGELQQIETELFRYSLTSVLPTTDPQLEGVEFVVEEEAVAFRCRACDTAFGTGDLESAGNEHAVEAMHLIPELAHAYIRCPSCAGPDFEIVAGRGVTLQRIEGSGDDGQG
jgi:hydrogenase nickel incorporation protein HypA/HybF